MIFLIVVILLFIALILFIVLSAKETHWMNLVGVFFVFIFAVFYMMMVANVLPVRQNWLEAYQKTKASLEKQQLELDEAVTGSLKEVRYPENSVMRLENQNRAAVFGRGRVWRECTPGAFNPGATATDLTTGSLVVDLPPNSPKFKAEKLENVPGLDNVENIALVYVFLEHRDPNTGTSRLGNYIGSFFANNPTDDNKITLTPSLILPDPVNVDQIKAANPNYRTPRELITTAREPDTFWTMYDILPTDSWDLFTELWRAEMGDPELEVTVEMLRDEVIPKYMPIEKMRMQDDPAKYETLVNQIIYTGRQKEVYSDEQILDTLNLNEDDNLWYEIEFLEKATDTIKVDFDSSTEAAQKEIALRGPSFNRDGLALVEVLKMGEPIEFKKGDTVLLDHESWKKNPKGIIATMKEANQLAENKIIYRRKLNDFDYSFRQLVATNTQLTSDRNHAQEKLDQGLEIEKMYETQKKSREDLVTRLNKDVQSFKSDLAAVETYLQGLEADYAAKKAEIDRLFRLTKELLAKKTELEAKALKQAEERTRKAAEDTIDTE